MARRVAYPQELNMRLVDGNDGAPTRVTLCHIRKQGIAHLKHVHHEK